ncbi:MAG: GNAT family N-acetyltransferase [Halobacteriovoraceae bacterium]|nr:GNAT family N-acetyltransferase [Halobacteriovoraceae bacterium]MBT5095344.1 GNAT family N-acetyltransferase [Halobacteriovoraceae bacterium]
MKVLQINANDTIPIRHRMLRKNQTTKECVYPGDAEDQTFHLGAFEEGRLVSVASFYFQNNPKFEEPLQYRLRGMATLPENQKKGSSSALLKIAFPLVKQNQGSLVWCNAREAAVGFYKKVGFEVSGKKFNIPGIGEHFLMFKKFLRR